MFNKSFEKPKKEENNKNKEKFEEKEYKPTFERYMNGLDLEERDLKDKSVLDLGCGNGDFIKSLIKKGITKDAHGLDLYLDKDNIEKDLQSHFTKGNFEDSLPVNKSDYIISVGSVSLSFWAGEDNLNINKILENSLNSLKENGEIRIYPIKKPKEGENLKGLEKSYERWKEVFKELDQRENVDYELKTTNERKIGNDEEEILESVLIIKKK